MIKMESDLKENIAHYTSYNRLTEEDLKRNRERRANDPNWMPLKERLEGFYQLMGMEFDEDEIFKNCKYFNKHDENCEENIAVYSGNEYPSN